MHFRWKQERRRPDLPRFPWHLVEAAWATSRTRTRLGARYRHLHRRFGKTGSKKAAVAVAHTILVIVWHLLANDQTYTDLGADYYTNRDDPETRKNRLLRQLHDLGYQAELPRTRGIAPHAVRPSFV